MTILFLIVALSGMCQTKGVKPIAQEEAINSGITRAVVVGISDYQNDNITDLQYAHKDAQIFADYLKDPNGLNLQEENITLLLNEEATSGQFVSALYGMLEDSKEGDLNIIYFSGHGDVESTTINQPGFLLCWDAPSRVYMSGGTFGLAYLQEIISTLSLQTKSKVVMISDACRAGKLAGTKIGGSQATAANLSKKYANEVKILSCQPDEFALEGESWGGGRGVFSFYLMAGIRGLADRNEDGEVTLSEIGRYLEDNVSESVAPHSQIPMIVGSRNTVLAQVNEESLAKAKEEVEQSSFRPSEERAIGITQETFEDTTKYNTYVAFNQAMARGHFLFPYEGSAYAIFEEIKGYDELQKYVNVMRRNLSAALQDEAQQAINKYLVSDAEELRVRNRWQFDDKYSKYYKSLQKAAELVGPNHFFYKTLKARAYYFKGLTYRINGIVSRSDSLLNLANLTQDSCLALEPGSPHSLNEKGFTNFKLNNFNEAIKWYNQAIELAPTWALVYSNLAQCYIKINEYNLGYLNSRKSIELDSTLIYGYYNLGLALEKMGKLDSTMILFQKTLELDSLYFPVYSKLSRINYLKNNYSKAYEFGLKAYEIYPKSLPHLINLAHICLKYNKQNEAKKYFDLAYQYYPNAEEAYQGQIEYYFYTGDMDNAEIELNKYLRDYPDDNFAYYLVSSIQAGKEQNQKAILNLHQAIKKGFRQFDTVEKDPNFSYIIQTKAYKNLIKEYDER